MLLPSRYLNTYCTLWCNCHASRVVIPCGRLYNDILQCQPFWPNLFHWYDSAFGMINLNGLFDVNLNKKSKFLQNLFIFIMPRTIVFNRRRAIFMLHVSLSPVLGYFKHFRCQICFLDCAPESHWTHFLLKTHKPPQWSHSLEKRAGN